jgi:hypothetical protein
LPTALFGRARHLWMWDYKGLADELAAAGFTDIRRAQMGDNPDPRFKEVESIERWPDCLGVDCKRPLQPTAPAPALVTSSENSQSIASR